MFFNFDDIFDRLYNNFNSPVKDMSPFRAYKNDSGYLIVCKTLGIAKEDIKVTLENESGRIHPVLKIKGNSTLEKIDFKNTVDLGIQIKTEQEIKKISYKVKDGLTIVQLYLEEPKPVAGVSIDYDDDFKF